MDWFVYNRDLRHERVKLASHNKYLENKIHINENQTLHIEKQKNC